MTSVKTITQSAHFNYIISTHDNISNVHTGNIVRLLQSINTQLKFTQYYIVSGQRPKVVEYIHGGSVDRFARANKLRNCTTSNTGIETATHKIIHLFKIMIT